MAHDLALDDRPALQAVSAGGDLKEAHKQFEARLGRISGDARRLRAADVQIIRANDLGLDYALRVGGCGVNS